MEVSAVPRHGTLPPPGAASPAGGARGSAAAAAAAAAARVRPVPGTLGVLQQLSAVLGRDFLDRVALPCFLAAGRAVAAAAAAGEGSAAPAGGGPAGGGEDAAALAAGVGRLYCSARTCGCAGTEALVELHRRCGPAAAAAAATA
jgi:hypothetical protein